MIKNNKKKIEQIKGGQTLTVGGQKESNAN